MKAKDTKSPHVITVVFFGGILESVEDCPENTTIVIHDYDTQSYKKDEIEKDDQGRGFHRETWESSEPQHTITLIIDGLLVQEVIGIPPEVRVVAKEYGSSDGLAEHDVREDDDGTYYQIVWDHDTKPPLGPRIPHPIAVIAEHFVAMRAPLRCPGCGVGIGGDHAEHCKAKRCKVCGAFGIPKGGAAEPTTPA